MKCYTYFLVHAEITHLLPVPKPRNKAAVCKEMLLKLQLELSEKKITLLHVTAIFDFLVQPCNAQCGNWAKKYGLNASSISLVQLLKHEMLSLDVIESLFKYGMQPTGREIPYMIKICPKKDLPRMVSIVSSHYTQSMSTKLLQDLLNSEGMHRGRVSCESVVAALQFVFVSDKELVIENLLASTSPCFKFLLSNVSVLRQLFDIGVCSNVAKPNLVQNIFQSAVTKKKKAEVLTCLLENGCNIMELQCDQQSPVHVAALLTLLTGLKV